MFTSVQRAAFKIDWSKAADAAADEKEQQEIVRANHQRELDKVTRQAMVRTQVFASSFFRSFHYSVFPDLSRLRFSSRTMPPRLSLGWQRLPFPRKTIS